VSDPDHRPEGFLVDFDGVLVSSHRAHLAAYESALAQHGLRLPPSARSLVLGGAGRERVLSEAGVPPHLLASLSRAKEDAFITSVRSGALQAAVGATAFLRALKRVGCPAAVVSNSASARLCVEAMGWTWAFREVVGASDVTHPKPDPEPFLAGARVLGVPPGTCVAVDDSPDGVAAARSSGAFVVGVGTGVASGTVDFWAPDLSSIPLRRWFSTRTDERAP
jgi:beta-phosphoglucomutase